MATAGCVTAPGSAGVVQPTPPVVIVVASPTPAATAVAVASPPGAAVASATSRAGSLDLRTVNWRATLASDPALKTDPSVPGANLGLEPYIETVSGVPGAAGVSGHPQLDAVVYGMLRDGDSSEQAVIPLFSGGTAGTVGAVIYGVESGQPRLLAAIAGYKMGFEALRGAVIRSQVAGAGWESNCCWSGLNTAVLRLDPANRVYLQGEQETGYIEARPRTVERFYELLGERKFREAYAFLSPGFQAGNPFNSWQTGFSDLVSVTATAREAPAAVPIPVDLTVTRRTPAGRSETVRFAGSWTLVYSPTAHQWLLDTAALRQLP